MEKKKEKKCSEWNQGSANSIVTEMTSFTPLFRQNNSRRIKHYKGHGTILGLYEKCPIIPCLLHIYRELLFMCMCVELR